MSFLQNASNQDSHKYHSHMKKPKFGYHRFEALNVGYEHAIAGLTGVGSTARETQKDAESVNASNHGIKTEMWITNLTCK